MNPTDIPGAEALKIVVKLRTMARAAARAAATCPRMDDAIGYSNYSAGLICAASVVGAAAGIYAHEVIPDDGTWDE